jgi:hypothetical protein
MGAAMIGGTAYVAHKAGQRQTEAEQQEYEQEMRLQALEAQQTAAATVPVAAAPAPAQPAAGGTDIASKLGELKALMDQGVLTPEEFAAAKQKLLAG